jgi:glucose/arabinose dehydrogenase
MRALKITGLTNPKRFAVLLLAIAGLGLAGCDNNAGDPARQIGANPVLPALQQYFMPPIRIAKAVGWEKGGNPTVPQGLQIHPLATGLEHPRSIRSPQWRCIGG